MPITFLVLGGVGPFLGCNFLLAVGSFLLTAELFCLQLCLGVFFCLQLSFFAYSGKVCRGSADFICMGVGGVS